MSPDRFRLFSMFDLAAIAVLFFASVEQALSAGNDEEPAIPPGMQKFSFKSPNLTEEDEHSHHMPADLKCDACTIIAYQLTKIFEKRARKFHDGKKVAESEILDMVEAVCKSEFDEYGVKEMDGRRRLSGPGLEADKVPGFLAGGGRWPSRIREMCLNYAGELGEEEIFRAWQDGETLQNFLCHNKDVGSPCSSKIKSKSSGTKKTEF